MNIEHHRDPEGSAHALDMMRLDRFERISRLARRIFHMPVASLIVNDDERTDAFAPASAGGGQSDHLAPTDSSLWAKVIPSSSVVIVRDALDDARLVNDPLVAGPSGLRFLASCPLTDREGARLGTLVLGDRTPRSLGDDDLACLEDLASTVAAELAMARNATTDELTLLLNRGGFMRTGTLALQLCKRQTGTVSLLYFDLNDFKQINDRFGHHEGDLALAQFAQLLCDSARSSDLVARLGGDEFAILAHTTGPHGVTPLLARLKQAVEHHNAGSGKPYQIRYSVGCTSCDTSWHKTLEALMQEADAKMYAHKARAKASRQRSAQG